MVCTSLDYLEDKSVHWGVCLNTLPLDYDQMVTCSSAKQNLEEVDEGKEVNTCRVTVCLAGLRSPWPCHTLDNALAEILEWSGEEEHG